MREYTSTYSRIQVCAGPECRNAVIRNDSILEELLSEAEKIEASLNSSRVRGGEILRHRLFSISASYCPNACSRPQIADFGIIAASPVHVTGAECTGCNACIELCREEAIRFKKHQNPEIIEKKCLYCGTCSGACPSGTLSSAETGYRIFIGGMMGRHPAFAGELPFIYDRESVVELFKDSFVLYNELFDSQLRFRNMVLRYPEKLPAPRREIFLTALGN